MDLVTFSPDNFSRFLVDVTVRTPHATRCTQASVRPGEAASFGASDKRERYGETVLALPRMGDLAMRLRARCGPWHKRLSVLVEMDGQQDPSLLEDEAAASCASAVADVALLAMYGCRPEGGSAEWG